jgi:hypothetical protein
MGTVSHKTNPTSLRILDRKLAVIHLDRSGEKPSFRLEKLDLEKEGLPAGLEVVVTASAGTSRSRHLLGRTGQMISHDPIQALDMDQNAPFCFRITFTAPGDPKIIAMIDGIRPKQDDGAESLIPMERVDLGERIWRLSLGDGDGPRLLINKDVFPSALAAESYLPFSALVIPEVLRLCLEKILRNRDLLESDGPWSEWKSFIDSFDAEIPDEPGEDEVAEIVDGMVSEFCRDKNRVFATKLLDLRRKENSNE